MIGVCVKVNQRLSWTYPVFILSYLLHLEPLGTFTLGHLPSHLHNKSVKKKKKSIQADWFSRMSQYNFIFVCVKSTSMTLHTSSSILSASVVGL